MVNYTDFIKCLLGEFSVTEDVSHEATLPLSRSPIIFEPIGQCLSYLLALLEFTGHTYEGQDIIAAANRLSIPRRKLGRCSELCTRRDGLMISAALAKHRLWILTKSWDVFEAGDALNDFATARCNQRYAWHAIWCWGADALVSSKEPTEMSEWDVVIRVKHHWAIGLGDHVRRTQTAWYTGTWVA